MSGTETVKLARAHLTPALAFHTGIVAGKAEGLYVTGTDGRTYMDFSSGLATTNIGHCPPAVVKAAAEQMKSVLHSGCIFYTGPQALLAEKLSTIAPEGIEMFFFSNSGAEAVEGAIKLARHATGRQGVIAFIPSFHGRTFGALSLTTSSARYRSGYHPLLPSVYHAPYPYCFRCPMGTRPEKCSTECFDYLRNTVLGRQITPGEVACVVIEPVLGEGGYVVPPRAFMEKLRELCTAEGMLLVADEVQSGFGRTGRWNAVEHFAVRPDIVTYAKGIASGFPLSAVGSTKEIMERWPPGAHGTTFGGNPVSCAASLATIGVIEDEGLLDHASRLGEAAIRRLRKMQERRPSIGDVRGLGLMIGVELVKDDGGPDKEGLAAVIKRCLEAGLIIIECGEQKNVARLMPPINITADELSRGLDIFEEALG